MEAVTANAGGKKRKRSEEKKNKKKQKEEEQVLASAAEGGANGHLQEKKKKKKKKQNKDTNGEAAVATNGHPAEAEKKKKKKKTKKQKKSDEPQQTSSFSSSSSSSSSDSTTNGTASPSPSSSSSYSPSSRLSAAETTQWRKEQGIAVSSDGADDTLYPPILSFDEARQRFTPTDLLDALCHGFQRPTPIQSQCWPILLANKDVIGIAETGSGKTLAFLLPALCGVLSASSSPSSGGKKNNKWNKSNNGRTPQILVLAPTRELAMQTADVGEKASQYFASASSGYALSSLCVYGGVNKYTQRQALQAGVDLVVATPGRLLDLVEEGCLSLDNIRYLVLDEADRMLDLGFEKDIRNIIGRLPTKRQTLMFSATWPTTIQNLASEFLAADAVRVTIGSEDLTACKSVKQIVEVMEPHARDERLNQLLRQYHKSRKNRILIFVLYKKEAPRLESMLRRSGWKAQAIHGDRSQHERTQALETFKNGNTPLLIATDVAARGLDIPDVEYVINYSFPLTIEDYIHRIGRTGRAGNKGVAHTLFTRFDKARAGELANVLREAGNEVPEELLKFGAHVKRKDHALYGQAYKGDASAPMPARKHITFD
ncbi:RNA-dependent ATPase [Balamuthia mandrillaris]